MTVSHCLPFATGYNTGEECHRCGWHCAQRAKEAKFFGYFSPPGGSGWSQCSLGKDHAEKRR